MEDNTNELTIPLDAEQEAANKGEITEAQSLANEQLERQIQARAEQQASAKQLPAEKPPSTTGMFAKRIAEAQELTKSATPNVQIAPEKPVDNSQSVREAFKSSASGGNLFSRLFRK